MCCCRCFRLFVLLVHVVVVADVCIIVAVSTRYLLATRRRAAAALATCPPSIPWTSAALWGNHSLTRVRLACRRQWYGLRSNTR